MCRRGVVGTSRPVNRWVRVRYPAAAYIWKQFWAYNMLLLIFKVLILLWSFLTSCFLNFWKVHFIFLVVHNFPCVVWSNQFVCINSCNSSFCKCMSLWRRGNVLTCHPVGPSSIPGAGIHKYARTLICNNFVLVQYNICC